MVVMSLSSHHWSFGSTLQRRQNYSVLLPRKWLVQMMGQIMRLCIRGVSWLLQNGRDWGCENGEAGVCGQTVEDWCDSLLMPVCGSVGRWGEPLWELNGLPWEHFVENQWGGRGDRDRRPDLVGRREGRGGEPQTECLILWLVWNLPYDSK